MPVLTEELAHLRRDNKGNSGHRWQVSCLEYSPNGSMLASGSWDKEIRVWDLSTLETSLVLKGVHEVPVTSVSWHKPTGSLLCAGSADCTASLWNTHDGRHLASLQGHSGWVLDVCFSYSSQLLATASWDKTIKLWDPVKQKQISNLAHHEKGVWSVDFKPVSNSSLLCSGSEDGTVCMWDARSNRLARRFEGGHTAPVYCVRWSPDGAMLATGSEDCRICIWEPGSGSLIKTIQGHDDTVKSLCFNPQTQNVSVPVLASAGDYTVRLFDPRPIHKPSILSLTPHEIGKEVEAVSISPDGSLLASGGRDGMIVLMTLFVPSLVPRTGGKTTPSPVKQADRTKIKIDRSYIKEFSSIVEDERDDRELEAEREAQEMEDILSAPQNLTPHQIAIRMKRRSRADAKVAELDDYATVRKKNVSAKKQRRRRTKGKAFDIPSVVAHLSASTKAYGPEEPESSDDSDDGRRIAAPKMKMSGGEGIVERMAKLTSPQDKPARTPAKPLDRAEFGRLKKQFEEGIAEEDEEELEDPEAEFLQQHSSRMPRSSTFDSSLTYDDDSEAGQYGVLSQQRRQLKSSIQFETADEASARQGLLHRLAPSDSFSDQFSDISDISFSPDPKHGGRSYHHQNISHLEGIEESQGSRTEIDAEDPEDYFKFLEEEQDDEDTISMI